MICAIRRLYAQVSLLTKPWRDTYTGNQGVPSALTRGPVSRDHIPNVRSRKPPSQYRGPLPRPVPPSCLQGLPLLTRRRRSRCPRRRARHRAKAFCREGQAVSGRGAAYRDSGRDAHRHSNPGDERDCPAHRPPSTVYRPLRVVRRPRSASLPEHQRPPACRIG